MKIRLNALNGSKDFMGQPCLAPHESHHPPFSPNMRKGWGTRLH
jgi:hypothetical protein